MATCSRTLYEILDHLGYNDDMMKYRREMWKYTSSLFATYQCQGFFRCVTAGSKGEGITSLLESDLDQIFLHTSMICIDSVDQLPSQQPPHVPVFLTDMVNVPPGYTRLKLYRPSSSSDVTDRFLRDCLVESENGDTYLSSSLWTATATSTALPVEGMVRHDVTGPAIPVSSSVISTDNVIALTAHCPQLLQSWASRPRHHEWPSRDTIQAACSFLPQVVPVGAKGSDRQFQEWRFCFIESELTLTHSLNGTQIKLYILLKMIAKSVLKQVTGEISSYIMKNITYWISESNPLHVFRDENLVSLVLLALRFLRTAITEWQSLPYYMIPSRNLLSWRLDEHTRGELSRVLSGLLQEGPELLLRVHKLKLCLEVVRQAPNDIVMYGKMRDQVEQNALAGYAFATLKGYGVPVDESIIASLQFSTQTLLYLQLGALYEQSEFDADELQRVLGIILS